jgi:hypothetical protein
MENSQANNEKNLFAIDLHDCRQRVRMSFSDKHITHNGQKFFDRRGQVVSQLAQIRPARLSVGWRTWQANKIRIPGINIVSFRNQL